MSDLHIDNFITHHPIDTKELTKYKRNGNHNCDDIYCPHKMAISPLALFFIGSKSVSVDFSKFVPNKFPLERMTKKPTNTLLDTKYPNNFYNRFAYPVTIENGTWEVDHHLHTLEGFEFNDIIPKYIIYSIGGQDYKFMVDIDNKKFMPESKDSCGSALPESKDACGSALPDWWLMVNIICYQRIIIKFINTNDQIINLITFTVIRGDMCHADKFPRDYKMNIKNVWHFDKFYESGQFIMDDYMLHFVPTTDLLL